MTSELSCGDGLAAHASLPTKLAAIAETMAGVLASHQASLDVSDSNAATEQRTYASLEQKYRDAGQLLRSIAAEMTAAKSLPAAPHDAGVLTNEESTEAFGRFIDAKRDAVALLKTSITQDEAMLDGTKS
jgi:hypothetical protein